MDEWSDVRRKIEGNSPDITKLAFGLPSRYSRNRLKFYLPGIDELEGLGYHVGKNTNLKELVVEYCIGHGSTAESKKKINEGVEKFFRGVAGNTSIQSLHIHFKRLRLDGELFRTMIPFLKSNPNFESLNIQGLMTSKDLSRLASALREFDGLKGFSLDFTRSRPVKEGPASLIQALHGHSRLTEMHLKPCIIDRNGCIALGSLLQKPDTALRLLDIKRFGLIDNEGQNINEVTTLLGFLRSNPLDRLEELDLSSNQYFNVENTNTLMNSLSNNTTLRKLHLGWISNSDDATSGWRELSAGLSTILRNRISTLEELDLFAYELLNSGATDETLFALATSLENNVTFKKIVLGDIVKMSRMLHPMDGMHFLV